MGKTTISWTDYSFNPWRGCQKVNDGCKNCYADRDSKRFPKNRGVFGTVKQGGTRVVASESMWEEPVKWNRDAENPPFGRRSRVFCASLADVFEDWEGPMLDHNGNELQLCKNCGFVAGEHGHSMCQNCQQVAIDYRLTMDDCRTRLFRLIDQTPNLDWQLLTKRPENIRRMWPCQQDCHIQIGQFCSRCNRIRENVWLGTSGSDQKTANQAWFDLQSCNELVPVLFMSLEPLISPIDLDEMWRNGLMPSWIIVGGESGPNARPCNIEWIRDIVRQCKDADVPVFCKQVGSNALDNMAARQCAELPENQWWPCEVSANRKHGYPRVSLEHPKGGDINEWPEDLRVREFPQVDKTKTTSLQ